jgi:hypothetical protein
MIGPTVLVVAWVIGDGLPTPFGVTARSRLPRSREHPIVAANVRMGGMP